MALCASVVPLSILSSGDQVVLVGLCDRSEKYPTQMTDSSNHIPPLPRTLKPHPAPSKIPQTAVLLCRELSNHPLLCLRSITAQFPAPRRRKPHPAPNECNDLDPASFRKAGSQFSHGSIFINRCLKREKVHIISIQLCAKPKAEPNDDEYLSGWRKRICLSSIRKSHIQDVR